MNLLTGSADDTIAAVATGVGGAISILRVSGPGALEIGDRVWEGIRPLSENKPRRLEKGWLRSAGGAPIDHGLAVIFRAPASYTGEDTVEFHLHGGALVSREALHAVLAAGARHAEPGEFTRRAFLNGKLDLTQAEAVADVINAHTTMALHLANRQLAGSLGRQIDAIYDELVFLLSELESRLDFPEEALDWLSADTLLARLAVGDSQLARLIDSRLEGEILREGVRLVIAGPPNVGKSSLLNAILGRDRAIVTEIPGTTRDTIEELAHIRGIPVKLTDTAGLREARDEVEQQGIERSRLSLRTAQVVLWIVDLTLPYASQAPGETMGNTPYQVVANKLDLVPSLPDDLPAGTIAISAKSGQNLEALYDAIETQVWRQPHGAEPECAVSARHAALLETARTALAEALTASQAEQWELAASSLRTAAEAVGQVTGRTASPDVLDTIFARFCIGK